MLRSSRPARCITEPTGHKSTYFKFTDQQIDVLKNQRLPGHDGSYDDRSYDDSSYDDGNDGGDGTAKWATTPPKLPPGSRLQPN
jgi:hypothetical protein